MSLYKRFEVFRLIDGGAKVYNCFHDIDTNMYFVQSADFYRNGDDFDSKRRFFDRQLVELFSEEEISERSEGFVSIKEAILGFDKEFA
jgi:hypothetical protein